MSSWAAGRRSFRQRRMAHPHSLEFGDVVTDASWSSWSIPARFRQKPLPERPFFRTTLVCHSPFAECWALETVRIAERGGIIEQVGISLERKPPLFPTWVYRSRLAPQLCFVSRQAPGEGSCRRILPTSPGFRHGWYCVKRTRRRGYGQLASWRSVPASASWRSWHSTIPPDPASGRRAGRADERPNRCDISFHTYHVVGGYHSSPSGPLTSGGRPQHAEPLAAA
jgi:hypothetical protein